MALHSFRTLLCPWERVYYIVGTFVAPSLQRPTYQLLKQVVLNWIFKAQRHLLQDFESIPCGELHPLSTFPWPNLKMRLDQLGKWAPVRESKTKGLCDFHHKATFLLYSTCSRIDFN